MAQYGAFKSHLAPTRPSPMGKGGKSWKGAQALPTGGAGKGRVELYIPIQRCGLLIGKGGSMFKELKAAFGVHLTVPRAGDAEGTPTIIEGDPEQVEACFHKVSDAVYNELSVTNAVNVNIPAAGATAHPSQFHGAALPPARPAKASVLNQGKGKGYGHGMKGSVSPISQQNKGGSHGIKGGVGTGGKNSIQEQIRLLGQFNHPLLGPLRDASQHAEPSSAVFISEIPAQFDEYALYVLFAPFGPVIEVALSKASGVSEGVVRFIEPFAALTAAEQMHGVQLPGARSPLVVQLEASYGNVPQAEGPVRAELLIPIARCGLLIGPGGGAFKDLQDNFGVKLHVPSKGDPDGSLTVVEGDAGGVEACVQRIQAMVKGECQIMSS